MKKINLLVIIIFSTVVSVINMVYYSNCVNNQKHYVEDKLRKQEIFDYNKAYIQKETVINDNKSKVVKSVDEENPSMKNYLEKGDLSKGKLIYGQKSEDGKSSDNSNVNSSNEGMKKNNESEDSLENYNYYTQEQEQSVFKVSTTRIKEKLTTYDKIKLLHVSFKVGKENYKKVEEYLYAEDAEDGVLKALKLLKEDLAIKEYEKVRKIAEKFIDMDAAEKLK